MTQTSRSTYSTGAIILHWTIAILIFANFYIAFFHEGWSKETAGYWMGQHKAFGVTVIFLTVIRILWRLTHKPPPALQTHAKWEMTLAKIVQVLLYVMMIAVPLSGWLMSSYAGYPVNMFGLFEITLPVAESKAAAGEFHERHEVVAFMMLGLIVLHVAGALKHQFIDKDTTIHRMLPFVKRAK